MAEEWRPVVGYEGLYDVSNLGGVRRVAPANYCVLSEEDIARIRELRERGIYPKQAARLLGLGFAAVAQALRYTPKRYSFRSAHAIKPQLSRNGYSTVCLCRDRRATQARVHRLVVRAFIGPIEKGFECNHKNGIRSDNRLENLEIVTRSQNVIHARRVLLHPGGTTHGSAHYNSKLTEEQVTEMRALLKVGTISKANIARHFGIRYVTLWSIETRRSWNHIP